MPGKKRKKLSTESNEELKATETETQLVWLLRLLAWVLISTGQHLLDKDTLEQHLAAIGSGVQTYCHGILKGEYADSIEISVLLQRFLNADNTVQLNVIESADKRKKSNATVSLTRQGLLVSGTTYFLVPVKTEKSNGTKPHYLYVRFDNSDLEQFQIILNSGLSTDQKAVKSIHDLQLFLRDKCGLQSAVLHDVPGDGHCWYYMFLQLILCDATKRDPDEQLVLLELYLKHMLLRAQFKNAPGTLPNEMSLRGVCLEICQNENLVDFLTTGGLDQTDSNLLLILIEMRNQENITKMVQMTLDSRSPGSVSRLVKLDPHRHLINGFAPLYDWVSNTNSQDVNTTRRNVPKSSQKYVQFDEPNEVREIIRELAIGLSSDQSNSAGGSDSTHGGNTFWECDHCHHRNANTLNVCGNCDQPVGKRSK
jgi:hypothetical protein